MSSDTGHENKGEQGLDLNLSDIVPEDALRAFMETDPERVKKRLGKVEDREHNEGDEQ